MHCRVLSRIPGFGSLGAGRTSLRQLKISLNISKDLLERQNCPPHEKHSRGEAALWEQGMCTESSGKTETIWPVRLLTFILRCGGLSNGYTFTPDF